VHVDIRLPLDTCTPSVTVSMCLCWAGCAHPCCHIAIILGPAWRSEGHNSTCSFSSWGWLPCRPLQGRECWMQPCRQGRSGLICWCRHSQTHCLGARPAPTVRRSALIHILSELTWTCCIMQLSMSGQSCNAAPNLPCARGSELHTVSQPASSCYPARSSCWLPNVKQPQCLQFLSGRCCVLAINL